MKKTTQTKPATPAAAPVPATPPPAPEAAPVLDPLRGVQNFYDLEEKQPKEAKALRAQLLGQIMQSLPKMATARVQEVAQFMDLCNNDRGCVTPVESFITDLVSNHYLYGGLTPDGVMAEFEGQEGFKVNYEEYVEGVDRFNLAYGQPAQAPAAAEPAAEPPAAEEDVDLIAWFADIEEADRGSDTPAENFVRSLVMTHHIRGLTPDDAARDLEEFRENFDCMAKAARIFSAKYPEAVKAATAA